MKTQAVFFPFDLFGGGGARAGAELLADAVREMLADNRRERLPTRARAYTSRVKVEELALDRLEDYQDWRGAARRRARHIWRDGDGLLWVSGNHLGVLPLYEELGANRDSLVVQLDAHLDIYHLCDCKEELTHGNFLLHASSPLPRVINLGHRELLLTPQHVGKYYERTFTAAELAIDAAPALATVGAACAAADRVLLDIDCDVLDPAFFPAATQPLPFGMSPSLLLRVLDAVPPERIIGLALSEFDPARDVRDQSLTTLIWLIEYWLLRMHEKVG